MNLIKDALEEDKTRGLNFTSDWFHGGIMYDIDVNVNLDKETPLHLLEIGSFEGKSSVWFIDTYLKNKNSTITIIDPYLTTDTTTTLKETTIDMFKHNISLSKYPDKVTFHKNLSERVLPSLVLENKEYDLIFIDGSHLRRDIILDIILSWKMLKQDGYMILDDYTNEGKAVKDSVDFWLKCLNKNEWDILHDRYQLIIHKLKI